MVEVKSSTYESAVAGPSTSQPSTSSAQKGADQPIGSSVDGLTTSTEPTVTKTFRRLAKRAGSSLPTVEAAGSAVVPSADGFTGNGIESILKDSNEFTKIISRKKAMRLQVNEVAFRGDSRLPLTVRELKTPMELFHYFFTKEIVQMITEVTSRCW